MTLSSHEAAVPADPAQAVHLAIRGMTCAACVGRVERALGRVPGVRDAQVNFATETALVHWQAPAANAVQAQALVAAVRKAGYEAHLQADDFADVSPEQHSVWADWGPAALGLSLSLPLMLPMLWGAHHFWSPWLQFLLATPVQFILGARFYRAAWAALKEGSGNMDQLVALGTTAAWGLSCWLWWSHAGQGGAGAHAGMTAGVAGQAPGPALYFESSAMVISLVLLGKALEARARRQTSSAIRALQALRPDRVHRVGPQGVVDVPLSQVVVGDVLVVQPGEHVPVDGEVVEGVTHVDESMLTGEPWPVARQPGDRLTGGAINQEGQVRMKVLAVGGGTLLARIIRSVLEAQAGKAPIQALVDRVSAVFVPTVLVLAALTGLFVFVQGGSVEAALIRAVAVLVIACPCALGLATPAALMAGTGAAARAGILIRNPRALELAHRVGVVVFDKTGTLTLGQPRLTRWTALPEAGLTPTQGQQVARLLQSGSAHPLAKAIMALQVPVDAELRMSDMQVVAGRGVTAVLQGAGRDGRWHLGSARWMRELLDDPAQPLPGPAPGEHPTDTLSWLAWQAAPGASVRIVAWMAFGDPMKPQSAQAVRHLHERGIDTWLLSGDRRAAAESVGRELGMAQVIAEVLPQDKADRIRELRQGSSAPVVAMVGDGVNDAPALASADVGMAVANPDGGSDVALEAADITLMRGDPLLVSAALDISHRTVVKIRQNLFWAFAYNVVGIPLAMSGMLSPVLAGTAMALSSISVLLNALWLGRWRAPVPADPPGDPRRASPSLPLNSTGHRP